MLGWTPPPGSSHEDTKQSPKVGEMSKTNDSVGKIHIKNDESLEKGQDGSLIHTVYRVLGKV